MSAAVLDILIVIPTIVAAIRKAVDAEDECWR
jgi:hypothetical protein